MDQRRATSQAAVLATGAVAGSVALADASRVRHNRRALGGHTLPTDAKGALPGVAALSKAQQAAVATYTNYANKPLNRWLRTGEVREIVDGKLKLADPGRAAGLKAIYAKTAGDLAGAFERSTLPQGTRLFRGIDAKDIGGIAPGKTISDAAVTSTSRAFKQADAFYEFARRSGGKPAMMVVDAGGARGIDVASISKFAYEKEVILAPKTALHVTHVAEGVKRSLFDRGRTYAFAGTSPKIPNAAPAGPSAPMGALAKLGMVAGPALAGAQGYQLARNAGANEFHSVAAGVGSAGIAAGIGYGIAVAAPALGKVAARALPGLGLALAAYGAYQGYQKGGDLKSAALGAAGLDAFIPDKNALGGQRLTADQQRRHAFEKAAAEVDLDAKRKAGQKDKPDQPKSDGWTDPYERVNPKTGDMIQVGGYRTVIR